MALRDWPLRSAATTGSEDRGAARRVDVRPAASPLGVNGHNGACKMLHSHQTVRVKRPIRTR